MNYNDLTKLKRSFPKNISISGRDEFFNSSVLIPLILIEGEYHFIFQKRSKNISQAGEVCFPGGKIDDEIDKDSEETALRETYEEFSIDRDKINIMGRVDTVFSPIGAMVDGYVGIVNIKNLKEIKINLCEVEYIFTVPVSFFENNKPERYYVEIKAKSSTIDGNGKQNILLPVKKLNLPKIYEEPWGNYKYKIYVYKYNGEVIWGLTARFIFDIIKMLKNKR